ncbi:MAG: hypothetical protein H6740_11020 [Alphaproteobacteria bacterium]|nr:hypothetical protein [Alphaproteobacteria bacterium]
MNVTALLLVAFAALGATAVSVLYRLYMRAGGDLGTLLLLQSLPTGLALALLLRPAGLMAVSPLEWAAFGVAGLLWAAMAYLDVRAYEEMGAGVNAILNTTRIVLLTGAGLWLFSESMSATQALGSAIVWIGVLGVVAVRGEVTARGLALRGGCVLVGSLALTVDKWLTGRVDPGLVTLSGYIVSGLYFAVQQRGRRAVIAAELARSWPTLLATCALYGAVGAALIYAMAEGQLWTTMLLYESRVLLTFAVGALFLGERRAWRRRAAAALLCVGGVALILRG